MADAVIGELDAGRGPWLGAVVGVSKQDVGAVLMPLLIVFRRLEVLHSAKASLGESV